MMARKSMGRRRASGWAEQDAFTSWRRVCCYLQRPGVTASIKRQARRRERRKARQQIREES